MSDRSLPTPGLPEDPPTDGGEGTMLAAFLDLQRGVLLRKVGELPEDDLRRPMTRSGLTLLGMLKHLAHVERYWFQQVFAGEDVDFPWSDEDPDADWRAEADETPAEIAALYGASCERSRAIVATASLDDTILSPRGATMSLRWIMLHMIEETARHLGHADLMRESLDGRTGD
jgi:uncharacterized damage-inducible protein DinB